MKPPVKLDELMQEWSNDCQIDSTEPGLALIKISTLHAKYLNILSYHRIMSKKVLKDYDALKLAKFQYYHGDIDQEELQARGWEPNGRLIVKQNIPMYLDADEELNAILMKKIIHDEVIDFCTSVIRELNSRVFALRSFIDWQKFTNPG